MPARSKSSATKAAPKKKNKPQPRITELRIWPTHRSGRGTFFRVERKTDDGYIPLLDRSRDPEHDAARELRDLYIPGLMVSYLEDRSYPSFPPRPIDALALHMVSETEARGLVRRKWVPSTFDLVL